MCGFGVDVRIGLINFASVTSSTSGTVGRKSSHWYAAKSEGEKGKEGKEGKNYCPLLSDVLAARSGMGILEYKKRFKE